MIRRFKEMIVDESGATAVEYGLIAGLIALAVVTAVNLVASNLKLSFNAIASHFGSRPN